MTDQKTEYYVRFKNPKYGTGIHESPCQNIEEAAGQFAEDVDCVSAIKMVFDKDGKFVSGNDVTDEVVAALKALVSDDTWTQCPHPIVEDFFNEWSEEAERQAEADRDHERTEIAMTQV